MKLRESAHQHKFSWYNFLWIGGVHLLALGMAVPFFTWQGLVAFVFCYVLTAGGITFGFHRLLTHRGFKTPQWLENLAAIAGTLACQGGPVSWVAGHRNHHVASDTEMDPHNAAQGFWHAHMLWIFDRRQDLDCYEDYRHYAPDMANKPFMVWLDRHMVLVQVIFGVSLGILGGLIGPQAGFDWHMAGSFVGWGVFVRLVAVYHGTWFVNSAAHKWGTNDNNLKDLSRNLWWVAILALGEGWHNNHHAQPRSARHGWSWKQPDFTWGVIRTLEVLGLARSVVRPRPVGTSEEAEPLEVAAPLVAARATA